MAVDFLGNLHIAEGVENLAYFRVDENGQHDSKGVLPTIASAFCCLILSVTLGVTRQRAMALCQIQCHLPQSV